MTPPPFSFHSAQLASGMTPLDIARQQEAEAAAAARALLPKLPEYGLHRLPLEVTGVLR